MGPRIGELCAGYGGLGMGVKAVLGGEVAWVSDIDKGANKILAHRFPGVPNIGDMTAVDWSTVEPVDILTGGTPCQDLSHAGRRAGMTEGTRSNLWVAMREAIATIRPQLVVWENVGGAFSATATSEVEPCAGCLGDGGDESALRALHRVLGDLASLGFDAEWVALRAADVGAPHGRLRVFVIAHPTGDAGWFKHGDGSTAADASHDGSQVERLSRGARSTLAGNLGGGAGSLLPTPAAYDGDRGGPQHPDKRRDGGHSVTLQDAVHGLLPTPRATDGTKGGPNQRGSSGDLMLPSAVTLLPTPAVNDMGEGKTVEAWDEWTAKMQAAHGNGNGHGKSLAIEAQRLLPTPEASRAGGTPEAHLARKKNADGSERTVCTNLDLVATQPETWGIYADAIARWEALTRPAPAPTQPSKKGTPQLSARFSEWLMGVPDGWVTDVPGITRNEALKALGNGVVPQQCATALRFLLSVERAA